MTDTKAKKKQTDTLEEDYRYREYDSAIMGRLMSYLKPYAWRVVLAAAIMAAIALIALARPWIVSQIVDVGIGQNQPGYLVNMVFVYLGLNAFSALATIFRINLMAWVGTSAIFKMRNQIFGKFQELSMDFFSEHEVGRLMSRMTTDVMRVQDLITWSAYKSQSLLTMVLYYLRFAGYWLVVILLLIMSQTRSARWTKAILRRLEII